MVWVNGHAMGRFWEIGPQQTLFMPGCWLKEGENEILVLDLKGPAKASIKGLKKPILDVLREKAPETHRKDGEKLKLAGEKVDTRRCFHSGQRLAGSTICCSSERTLFLFGSAFSASK